MKSKVDKLDGDKLPVLVDLSKLRDVVKIYVVKIYTYYQIIYIHIYRYI